MLWYVAINLGNTLNNKLKTSAPYFKDRKNKQMI